MRALRLIEGASVMLLVAGCATVPHPPESGRLPMHQPYRLLLVHPNIQVRELTAEGALSFREEWAEVSRRNMAVELQRALSARAGPAVVVVESKAVQADAAKVAELHLRHDALGRMMPRPNTVGRSLGDVAMDVGAGTTSELLFVMHADFTVRTAGRKALIGAGMLGCSLLEAAVTGSVGSCGNPDAGDASAFASLVDAGNGEILWTVVVPSGPGDLREEKKAAKLARALTKKLPDLKPVAQ